jgi:hypothetical protein
VNLAFPARDHAVSSSREAGGAWWKVLDHDRRGERLDIAMAVAALEGVSLMVGVQAMGRLGGRRVDGSEPGSVVTRTSSPRRRGVGRVATTTATGSPTKRTRVARRGSSA